MVSNTAFYLEVPKEMCDKFNVKHFFRAAYGPSGNEILERDTMIEAMEERGHESPLKAVFWYICYPT